MKRPNKQKIAQLGAGLLASAILTPSSLALSGTWTNINGGSWPTGTNWSGGTIASGIDFVADFSTVNITAARTVTMDGARTIGLLKFGDATTPSHDWTLSAGSGGALTLSVTSGFASVNMVNRIATISAVVAGNDGLEATGPATNVAGGTLILSGANTFTGGLKITGANVQLNNNAAAGSNLVSISTSPYAAAPTANLANKLMINGGVTISNNVEVASGANPLGGRGIIEQTGTGQATINGSIAINGGMKAGGHFLGGGVGNELVLNGTITSTVQVTQRAGNVIYRGRGTGFTSLGLTGTALIGTTNGLPIAVNIAAGLSGAGTLDLNGFDQTIGSLTLGSGANSGTLNVRGNKLTLNGNLTHAGTAVGNIIGTGGSVDVGSTPRTLTVANGAAVNDLVVTSTALLGSGGLTKVGAGTLALLGSTVESSLAVSAGEVNGNFSVGTAFTLAGSTILTPGSLTSNGTITAGSLAFGLGTTTLNMNLGPTGNSDLITTGALTSEGVTTINVSQNGGALAAGSYPVIQYTGTTPGLGAFVLTPFGRASAELEDTGSAIAVKVNSNDSVIWDGTNSTAWTTTATGNWKLNSNSNPADFIADDDVTFADTPTNPTVDIAANVSPSVVRFTNTTATTYTVTGTAGITGTANLIKTGDGTVILQAPSGYLGATTVSAGILELDHDATGNVVLTGTSGVALSAGTTLKLTRDDGVFTFTRSISGPGVVEVNPHSIAAGITSHGVIMNGASPNFSGTLKLVTPLSGTARATVTAAAAGTATIEVSNGSQFFTSANQVYSNNISIAGLGFLDASGNIGALRLEGGSVWAGQIMVDNTIGARIGSHNGTGTISGNISGGDLSVNANNYNAAYTLIFTGTNSYGKTVIGGENVQTDGVSSRLLNIGNGGITGTLGVGPVEIVGDGQNGVLRIDRADGYSLAQTITGITGGSAIANSIARTYLDVDTTGTGLKTNGNAITLGDSTSNISGGQIRVAQTRTGALFEVNSAVTSGVFRNGSSFRGTTTVKSGGSISAANIHTAIGSANATGSVMNIEAGATVSANYFTVGEVASAGGTVNQSGGNVSIIGQLRVAHYSTESSVYNMTGGTLTLTGAEPVNFPYTTASGGAAVVGDNNLDGLPATAIVGGGIYLGIDGHGVLNQSGGTISTNWMVLDNRADSVAGANMPNGNDTYALSGGTLILKSASGIITRNATASVELSGGIIQAASGVSPNLDTNKITVSGPATLDTNGANTFTLYGPLAGTGTVSVIGGGTLLLQDGGAGANTTPGGTMPGGSLGTASVNVSATSTLRSNRSLLDVWSGAVSGSGALIKENTGALTIAGSGTGFTGTTTVNAGRLDVPSDFASPTIVVADGATLGGEPTTTNLTLGAVAGSTLVINPATAGALTTTNLTLNGTILLDFSAPPPATGPITVLNYTTKTGSVAFDLVGAASYRPFTVTDTGTSIVLNFTNKNLVWTGTGGTFWDVNSSTNWDAGGADVFFFGDAVRFDDTSIGANTVTLSLPLNPSTVTVDSVNNNFTLVSGVGTSISGAATLTKLGSSTLTLTGANTYSGKTTIGGGTLSIATESSLGNGSATNTLEIAGGATLLSTATTTLGVNRDILMGTGGGKISTGTGLTLTIPGELSGNQPLNFTGGGVFVLGGDNSGYSGAVTLDSIGASAGGSTLRLTNSKAITSGSITVVHPDAPSATNSATGVDLASVSVPADVTLNMSANLIGANSFRSQLISSAGSNTWNGPIVVTGNNIIQVSSHAANGIMLNGPISAGTAGFTGTFFIRGAGTGEINGVVNLPGAVMAKTDASVWTINSTGNTWGTTSVLSTGSVKIGAHNALPIASTLSIGQASDAAASTMDLNGFNQEVAALAYVPGSGNSNRGITNTVNSTLSILTVNNPTAVTYGSSTGTTGGLIMGNVALVKTGAGDLTLGARNTFTGNVTVNQGTLIAQGPSNAITNGGLGSSSTVGRTITANASGIRLNALRVFGTGIGNANLPTIVLNDGATLTANRYSVVGAIQLNGSTLTSDHGTQDSPTLQAFQLQGAITVGGTAPSTISGAGDYPGIHLDTNTQFHVPDVTGSAAGDLTVTTTLLDSSADYFTAAAGMTKTGNGTLVIAAVSTFTGPTSVAAGTLLIQDEFNSPVTVSAGVLGGNGLLLSSLNANAPGAVVAPGSSVGILTVVGEADLSGGVLAIEIDDALPGAKSDKLAALAKLDLSGATLNVSVAGAAAQPAYIIATYDTLVGTFATTNIPSGYTVNYAYNDGNTVNNVALVPALGGYDAWAGGFGLDPDAAGLPSVDHDKDGIANGIEFVLGTDPTATTGADKLPTAEVVGSDIIFTFRRSVLSSSANPGAEKSTTLTPAPSWSLITSGIVVEEDGFGVGVDKVIVTIPKGAETRLFVRLVVDIP